MSSKGFAESLGTLGGILIAAATIYGTWHMADRHNRGWLLGLLVPPVGIYYAAESAWHSDGRSEVCGKVAQCGGTLAELGGTPRNYDECMRRMDIMLAGQTSSRQRAFERFAKSVKKMTCEDLSELVQERFGGEDVRPTSR